MFPELVKRLNERGRDLEANQLSQYGIKVTAATTPCSSFLGMFKGVKIYAYHDYPSNCWIIERS